MVKLYCYPNNITCESYKLNMETFKLGTTEKITQILINFDKAITGTSTTGMGVKKSFLYMFLHG